MSIIGHEGGLEKAARETLNMLEKKRQFDLDRMVEATRVFDAYPVKEACDKAWWWAQGGKFAAEGPLWDVLVDFQDVIEAIEEGVNREAE